MTYSPFNDYNPQIARGLVSGITEVNKFGRNPLVGTGTYEDVWFGGGTYSGWLTAASAVRVASGGNANDTAAGTGARTVTVSGLDQNWNEATETITLAGASASSATTTTFVRVNRAFAATSGTSGAANTGDITIETTGAVTLAVLEAGLGQTQLACYTVPDGKTAYITEYTATAGGTNDKAEIRLYQRQDADTVAAPFTSPRILTVFGVSGGLAVNLTSYISVPARSDIWASAVNLTSGNIPVSVTFNLRLVDA